MDAVISARNSGSLSAEYRRQSRSKAKNVQESPNSSVQLLSYGNGSNGLGPSYESSKGQNTSKVASIPPIVVKKSEKLFRTLRKRSKSASRISTNNHSQENPHRKPPEPKVRSGSNGSSTNSGDSKKVQLVGFSSQSELSPNQFPNGKNVLNREDSLSESDQESSFNNYSVVSGSKVKDFNNNSSKSPFPGRFQKYQRPPDQNKYRFSSNSNLSTSFGGSASTLLLNEPTNVEGNNQLVQASSNSGFGSKTSRQVKMEREKLRQERIAKETRDMFKKFENANGGRGVGGVGGHPNPSSSSASVDALFEEARNRFFGSTMDFPFNERRNEEFSGGGNSSSTEDFLRENRERFTAMLHERRRQMLEQQMKMFQQRSVLLTSPSSPSPRDREFFGQRESCTGDPIRRESTSSRVPPPTTNVGTGDGNRVVRIIPVVVEGEEKNSSSSSLLLSASKKNLDKVHKIEISRENIAVNENGALNVESRQKVVQINVKAGNEDDPKNVVEQKSEVTRININHYSENNNVQETSSGLERVIDPGLVVNRNGLNEIRRSSPYCSSTLSQKSSTCSSSGVSSLNPSSTKSSKDTLQRLQKQLAETKRLQHLRRSAFYQQRSFNNHPHFANHFGFNRSQNKNQSLENYTGSENVKVLKNSLSESTLEMGSNGLENAEKIGNSEAESIRPKNRSENEEANSATSKMALLGLKSKSSTLDSHGSSSDFRYHTDEIASSSNYGDSEVSEDDDEDEIEDDDVTVENDLDSVSLKDNKGAPSSAADRRGASLTSADSGRGESPKLRAKSSNDVRKTKTSKAPRPISAVPSEYSDISTTSSNASKTESSDSKAEAVEEEEEKKKKEVEDLDPDDPLYGAYKIACELLTTEEIYVSTLHLIDQIFYFRVDQENRIHNFLPPDQIPQMFANVKSIFEFHAVHLLPQLRDRMLDWKAGRAVGIGDILVKLSPFFKMYTEYVKNFGHAITTIDAAYQKVSKFAAIVDEIHSMEACRNLSLKDHMLTPIQRIPRYELLLKEYLKKLPKESKDREPSEKALDLVSEAASHTEDAMRRIDKFKKLLEVQESLGGGTAVDLISPTRELVKEGKIVKISARSGDHQERYLFLFSDLLLLCSNRLLHTGGSAVYKLRAKFHIDNLQVLEGDNLITANTFYIKDDHKSVELYTQTRDEKEAWIAALFQTIKELYERKSSLRIGGGGGGGRNSEPLRPLECEIGFRAPYLLKMESIAKCMECSLPFSMMRKKYHCKACGIVVCSKCSNQKFQLSFEGNKLCRVCRSCHELLVFQQNQHWNEATAQAELQQKFDRRSLKDAEAQQQQMALLKTEVVERPRGLLEVPADSPSIRSGYLILKSGGSTSEDVSVKRWFALLPDFVLYSFRNDAESSAVTATPMPGYGVAYGPAELKADSAVSSDQKDKTVKISCHPGVLASGGNALNITTPNSSHLRKVYYLVGNSVDEMARWAHVLKLAAKAEYPSETSL